MTIQVIPLQAGNAVLLVLDAIGQAKILRKTALPFTGHDDPDATLIFSGDADETNFGVLDDTVTNGIAYHYQAYVLVDDDPVTYEEIDYDPQSVTPAATYVDKSTDVRKILLDRIDLGFQQEIARGLLRIKPQPRESVGRVAVQSAPPSFQDTSWPVASVHLSSESQGERGIGETIDPGEGQGEGWLARHVYTLGLWSQNPDERNALHKALRRILMANLPVFDAYGVVTPQFEAQDQDFISGEYPAPVYASMFTFTCEAPQAIASTSEAPVIRDITVRAIASVYVIAEAS